MSWLFFALLSLVSFSFYEVLSRVAGVNAKNPRAFSAIYALLVSAFTLPLFLFDPLQFKPLSPYIIILTLLGLGIWTIFNRYEYYAHQEVEAATLAILLKLAPLITFALSIVFLKESFTLAKIFGVILIIVANLLILRSENPGRLRLTRGIGYALIIVLTLGFGWTIDKIVSSYFGAVLYTILSFGPPALVNALTPPLTKAQIIAEFKAAKITLPLLAIMTVFGYYGLIKALTLGEASRVIPIATETTPIVVLLAAIFLKETKHLKVKLFATALTGMGIFLLS